MQIYLETHFLVEKRQYTELSRTFLKILLYLGKSLFGHIYSQSRTRVLNEKMELFNTEYHNSKVDQTS